MRWSLAWVPHLEFLESLQRQGIEVQALDERPYLFSDLTMVWECFREVNRARQVGLSNVNPLTISEIRSWLEANSVSSDELPEMLSLVQDMDYEWRIWAVDQHSQEKEQADKNGTN